MPTIHRSHLGFICLVCGITALPTMEARAALPPDPDNAALLYYRAFMLRPEPDVDTYLLLKQVRLGADPAEAVRAHMKNCRDTVRLTDAATRIPQCNWGIIYSQGEFLPTDTLGQLDQLVFLLAVDAHVLAADGDYPGALDRVLSIRRLAGHIANDTIVTYSLSLQLQYCLYDAQYVLGRMPRDVDTLTWFQVQLSTVQGPPPSPANSIQMTFDQGLDPAFIARWKEQLTESPQGGYLLSLTEPNVIDRARELGSKFATDAQHVIGGDQPYARKRAELQRLADGLAGSDEPAAFLLLFNCPFGQIHKIYDIYVRNIAHFNAVRAAIEIYIETARSGQLPQTLPAHLPKDPFSDEEFEYQTTEGGFVLRCRAKEIGEDRIWEYEFGVPN